MMILCDVSWYLSSFIVTLNDITSKHSLFDASFLTTPSEAALLCYWAIHISYIMQDHGGLLLPWLLLINIWSGQCHRFSYLCTSRLFMSTNIIFTHIYIFWTDMNHLWNQSLFRNHSASVNIFQYETLQINLRHLFKWIQGLRVLMKFCMKLFVSISM